MLRFPHEPDSSALQAQLEETLSYLEGAAEPEHAEHYRRLGSLYYSSGAPVDQVVRTLRLSSALLCEACKEGTDIDAFDLWEGFLGAVAVGAETRAHFLSSLPPEIWIDEQTPPWPAVQCTTAFALFREEEGLLPRLLEQLRAFVLEEPLPEGFAPFVPETQNAYSLLHALHRRDSIEFHKHLAQRMELRARIYRGELRDDPEGLLDLPGLGLCRLARSRGMRTEIQSVYLPLPILDLPWEPTS